MTHHDLLIDTIMDHLYTWYVIGQMDSHFDSARAEKNAQEILQIVEEFQEARAKVGRKVTYLKPRPQWRASD